MTGGHSYTLTLISHDDGYAGDPTYTLYDDVTVTATTPPPPSPLQNGDFETGSLSPWTATGSATISSTAHGGTHSALTGKSGSATKGDSSVAQTFTAPAAGGHARLLVPRRLQRHGHLRLGDGDAQGQHRRHHDHHPAAKKCSNTGAWTQVTDERSSPATATR